ncbi:polysaccharide deacetylase family protein [Halothiobacillus sp.]|uniref:polysaccharide deacetylase family protein n=1 Tax=Halothiobacillus sp. TaxID=1891311 RepID=UPI002AD1FDAC|nr:polysaccharide deacetylase family protein [Halothiobacillus sp.]
MLLIETPDTRAAEREYVLGVVLGEFLGLRWRRISSERGDVRVTLDGMEGELRLPDVLLSRPESDWLKPASMPRQPLARWRLSKDQFEAKTVSDDLPIIYGDSAPSLRKEANSLRLPIDIFGSAFFMLSRYEEMVTPDRDEQDRFPAWASLAHKEGFLDRPIVDEYIEVLWSAMSCLWPELARRQRHFRVQVSHDVDHTSRYAFCGLRKMIRRVGGDVLLRQNYSALLNGPWTWLTTRDTLKASDPYNTFDWIMDRSEENDLKSAFYFMTGVTNPQREGDGDIDHPSTRDLIRRIHARGHEIGLHPSFETYLDPDQLRREADKLRSVLDEEGVPSERLGGRMHYLRWRTPDTMRAWAQAGMVYDSTLGYADQAGFRCGTCHEYPGFDIENGVACEIKIRPLIVMECSVFSPKYMSHSEAEGVVAIEKIRRLCEKFDGQFTLLWHNSEFTSKRSREQYVRLLK